MKTSPWLFGCVILWTLPGLLPGCPQPAATPFDDAAAEVALRQDLVQGEDKGPDTTALLPAPAVWGEPSAGHPHPTWLWELPEGTNWSRVRLDGGAWEKVAEGLTAYAAPAPLDPGIHLFEIQAGDGTGLLSEIATFETVVEYFQRPGYWDGVARDLAVSPLGNTAAISAHNCYLAFIDPVTSLDATRTMLQEAVAGGADLIELDVKEEGGVIFVDHDDDGSLDGATLADVLDTPELLNGDQILFIEIKENQPTEAFVTGLLDLLDARRAHFAHNGRPVVLRTFLTRLQNIALARQLLDGGGYPLIAPYIRLSVLFDKNNFPGLATFQEKIAQMAAQGFGMVEFQYQDRSLFGKLAQARSLGLGVNIWTLPGSTGDIVISALREEVDVLTTDLAAAAARAAVEEDNVLVYLNTRDQAPDGDAVTWHMAAGETAAAAINGAGLPSGAAWGTGEGLLGTVLEFQPDASELLPLTDGDWDPDAGVLVTAAVRFGRLALEDGETMTILAKSDLSGWTLELHDPPGDDGAMLRFGVSVDGAYRYGSVPADPLLNETDGFFITGAYGGEGPVRLWVDNMDDGVVNEDATGGVANNDALILLGADPHGAAAPRFHLDGAVQQAAVLRWGEP